MSGSRTREFISLVERAAAEDPGKAAVILFTNVISDARQFDDSDFEEIVEALLTSNICGLSNAFHVFQQVIAIGQESDIDTVTKFGRFCQIALLAGNTKAVASVYARLLIDHPAVATSCYPAVRAMIYHLTHLKDVARLIDLRTEYFSHCARYLRCNRETKDGSSTRAEAIREQVLKQASAICCGLCLADNVNGAREVLADLLSFTSMAELEPYLKEVLSRQAVEDQETARDFLQRIAGESSFRNTDTEIPKKED